MGLGWMVEGRVGWKFNIDRQRGSNPSSKTSIEQGELKNKVNIEAKIGIRFAAYNVLFGLWTKPQSIGEMFKEYDLSIIIAEGIKMA